MLPPRRGIASSPAGARAGPSGCGAKLLPAGTNVQPETGVGPGNVIGAPEALGQSWERGWGWGVGEGLFSRWALPNRRDGVAWKGFAGWAE